jgi:hypothetical protein
MSVASCIDNPRKLIQAHKIAPAIEVGSAAGRWLRGPFWCGVVLVPERCSSAPLPVYTCVRVCARVCARVYGCEGKGESMRARRGCLVES